MGSGSDDIYLESVSDADRDPEWEQGKAFGLNLQETS